MYVFVLHFGAPDKMSVNGKYLLILSDVVCDGVISRVSTRKKPNSCHEQHWLINALFCRFFGGIQLSWAWFQFTPQQSGKANFSISHVAPVLYFLEENSGEFEEKPIATCKHVFLQCQSAKTCVLNGLIKFEKCLSN